MAERSTASLAACFALLLPTALVGGVAEDQLRIPRLGQAAELYSRHCQGCHGHKGISVAEVPTLRGRAGWFLHTQEGREYIVRVPGVALALISDAELATVLNWMLETYSPEELPPGWAPFTAEEVSALRRDPLPDISKTRAAVVEQLSAEGVIPGIEALEFGPERDD